MQRMMILAGTAAALFAAGLHGDNAATAQMGASQRAQLNAANEAQLPQNFRGWPFLGAPLTPNALNGGQAAFPEFHHVYIDPASLAAFKRTGEFPEGTTIVKELVLLHDATHADGSRDEASGRGYFGARFAGIDMMVKDTKRFAETNGWGFYNFGHHAPPYSKTAAAMPNEACAACHTANATRDMVFTKFYPILSLK